jgi:hypothetical protein
MKTTLLFTTFFLILFMIIHQAFSQVEVKGTGTTINSYSLIIKNGNNDTSFVVKGNGFVGIDTVKPRYDLHVKGTIMTDTLRFSDGTIQTTSASYARVFTVAPSGGDFPDVQTALAACLNPSPTNQFLIRVMPGNYPANGLTVQCKKYVHLKGSGKYSTTINDPVVGEDSCVIEDFFLTQGITCNATSPTIIHNIITNASPGFSDGIYIDYGGRPWIKENEILDCNGFGINCITRTLENDSEAWIIANKIWRNHSGGIRLENSSPLISNNFINFNHNFGIWMSGINGIPTEPTIDDNVVGHTDFNAGGVGIFMIGFAEPRIIANDIYINETGIVINANTQPSILSNDINYNRLFGIRTFSNGAGKQVVIQGNHIHSSARGAPGNTAGIWISGNSVPLIAHNVVTDNDPAGANPDIDYSTNGVVTPVLNMNVYDIINRLPPPFVGSGQYNATSFGLVINP